jgi:hypothetical protein
VSAAIAESVVTEILAALRAEVLADPEPDPRFSPVWFAWQKRHWKREGRLTELRECSALTRFADDPCPPASLGLAPFLEWTCRNARRRRR